MHHPAAASASTLSPQYHFNPFTHKLPKCLIPYSDPSASLSPLALILTSVVGITSQALKLDRGLKAGTKFTPIVYQTAKVSSLQQRRYQVSTADESECAELSRSRCQTRSSQG